MGQDVSLTKLCQCSGAGRIADEVCMIFIELEHEVSRGGGRIADEVCMFFIEFAVLYYRRFNLCCLLVCPCCLPAMSELAVAPRSNLRRQCVCFFD